LGSVPRSYRGFSQASGDITSGERHTRSSFAISAYDHAAISMATSSGDDLPRQIEFLYSRNRLNVAISRARSLAVIVASPRLLETSCSTIEQLRLVNSLCWAKNFADGSPLI